MTEPTEVDRQIAAEFRQLYGATESVYIHGYGTQHMPKKVIPSIEQGAAIIAKHLAPERERAAKIEKALRSLINEAFGFVSMAEPATHGWTNIHVLEDRISAAKAALEKEE